jgi:Raf kinase inhibitor-like YbhB/YbcL family protein
MKQVLAATLLALLMTASSAMAMQLKSPDIADGGPLSLEQVYARCGGANISPALSWSGAPAGTRSFALTVIDTDVKPADWSHWIVIGLPAATTSLARGISQLPAGAKGLPSDFGDKAYDGPCPPSGSGVHHYQFTVWALGTAAPSFGLSDSAADIAAKLSQVALDKATLTGTYKR